MSFSKMCFLNVVNWSIVEITSLEYDAL